MVEKVGGVVLGGRPDKSSPLKIVVVVLTAAAVASPLAARGDDKSDFQVFGDVMQYAMPAVALGVSSFERDGVPALFDDQPVRFNGSLRAFGSWASAQTTVHILKEITEEARPNNRDNRSFPSGHTASVFSAASFVTTRYGNRPNGWMYSLPAYGLALATAASRIDAEEHYFNDTVGGAGIALLYNWLWTTPYPGNYTVAPVALADGGYGVRMLLRGKAPEPFKDRIHAASEQLADARGDGAEVRRVEPEDEGDPRYRFQFAIGPLYFSRNRVQSPRDGTPIDIAEFGDDDNPRTTAAMAFDARIAEHHTLHFAVAPFELRSIKTLDANIDFDDETFPAFSDVRSTLLLNLYDIGWLYRLPQGERFDLFLGLGVTMRQWEAELETVDEDIDPAIDADKERFTAFARPTLGARWNLFRALSLHGQVMGMSYGDDWFLSASAQIRYQISRHWDLGIGYNFFQHGIDLASLEASSDWHLLALTFGYSFDIHPVETWLGL